MTLDEALSRIKNLEAKLDELEAAPADAAGEEAVSKKCPACGALNAADATECSECGASLEGEEAKMDAAARLEGERDAARTDAADAQTALEVICLAHAEQIAAIRKDADDAIQAKVRESVDVLTKAVTVLGRNAKIKLDGQDVNLVDAPLRDVKCAVIQAVKRKSVPAEKLDAYVDALFDDAIDSYNPGSKSVAAAKAIVVDNGRKDIAAAGVPAKSPEVEANEALKNRYATAWMAATVDNK